MLLLLYSFFIETEWGSTFTVLNPVIIYIQTRQWIALNSAASDSPAFKRINWERQVDKSILKKANGENVSCNSIPTVVNMPLSTSVAAIQCLTLSLLKVNLTKPRKLLNPELSNETYRCDHSNESSRWVLSNGGVHIVTEFSSCFCKFYV